MNPALPDATFIQWLADVAKLNGGLFVIALILLYFLVKEIRKDNTAQMERAARAERREDLMMTALNKNTEALQDMRASNDRVNERISEVIEQLYQREINGPGTSGSHNPSRGPHRNRRNP